MSTIDDVIARSRSAGSFSERRQFSIAKSRGIRKMREFALADPHNYVLELIQAAIANGATYVDAEIQRKTMALSFIGGGFRESELMQLFDFLFASKHDLELADIRQLALGVNALLIAEPTIVIESGDGTIQGTVRVEISGDTVQIGTPELPLNGTFLRASDLKRAKLGRTYGFGHSRLKELDVIDERCLTAPVPVLVNDAPLFGLSTDRTPPIFGYDRSLSFDEGDLYGTLGITTEKELERTRLLTFGVWIETIEMSLIEEARFGGIIAYDRLRKSADHASIVRDEVLTEMMARLQPYARQLRAGKSGRAVFDIAPVGGSPLTSLQLRALLADLPLCIAVPQSLGKSARPTLARIANRLDTVALAVGENGVQTLQAIGGPDKDVLWLSSAKPEFLEFLNAAPPGPPPRPWLIQTLEAESLKIGELMKLLVEQLPKAAPELVRLTARLGANRAVRSTIYTPAAADFSGLRVEVRTLDRPVYACSISTAWPGHQLVIDLPALDPGVLLKNMALREQRPLALVIAEVIAGKIAPTLQQASERVLATLAEQPLTSGSTAFRISLAALARSTLMRLRFIDGEPEISLTVLDDRLPEDISEIPLFPTLDGTKLSLTDLEALMLETRGMVYGAVPEIAPDLRGLDRSRILQLDIETEALLIAMLGPASYVRIDRREVLAEHAGVQLKEFSRGLQPKDFPFLLEGLPNGPLPRQEQQQLESRILRILAHRLTALDSRPPRWPDEKRQILRHLIDYPGHREELTDAQWAEISAVPLIPTTLGPMSIIDLQRHLDSGHSELVMADGWSRDVSDPVQPATTVLKLLMNPGVALNLHRILPIRAEQDVDLTDSEALLDPTTPDSAYLTSTAVDEQGLVGRLGVPASQVDDPSVLLINRKQESVRSHSTGRLGIVGFLQHDKEISDRRLKTQLWQQGQKLMQQLIDQLPQLAADPTAYQRAVASLLRFAAPAIQLWEEADGRQSLGIFDSTSQQILELPLFLTLDGQLKRGVGFLNQLRLDSAETAGDWASSQLSPDAPPVLRQWLEWLQQGDHVIRPAGQTSDALPIKVPVGIANDLAFAGWLSDTIEDLRPDREINPPIAVTLVYPAHGKALIPGKPHLGDFPMKSDTLHQWVDMGDGGARLLLNGEHELLRQIRDESQSDPEQLLWLVLSCYAHVNELLEPVTNDHELIFQRRVLDRLGKLEGPAQTLE